MGVELAAGGCAYRCNRHDRDAAMVDFAAGHLDNAKPPDRALDGVLGGGRGVQFMRASSIATCALCPAISR
jgi:hypothetical protein